MDTFLFSKEVFAERFTSRRKEMGFKTQNALARKYNDLFPSDRKNKKDENTSGILGTIKHYENPYHESNPNLNIVTNFCSKELLDCDIDYLVGRIDAKKHDINHFIDITGLSEISINRLIHCKPNCLVDTLLCSDEYFKIDYGFEEIISVLETINELAISIAKYDKINIEDTKLKNLYFGWMHEVGLRDIQVNNKASEISQQILQVLKSFIAIQERKNE